MSNDFIFGILVLWAFFNPRVDTRGYNMTSLPGLFLKMLFAMTH